jgi:hypothetical protein
MWFSLLLVLIAAFWLVIGVMLAKWLKQAGHTKPFKGRETDIYGGGRGYGRETQLQGSEREFSGFGGGGGRDIGLGGFGEGRVKGL